MPSPVSLLVTTTSGYAAGWSRASVRISLRLRSSDVGRTSSALVNTSWKVTAARSSNSITVRSASFTSMRASSSSMTRRSVARPRR